MQATHHWKGDGRKEVNFAVVQTEALAEERDELAGLFEVDEDPVGTEEEDEFIRTVPTTAEGTPAPAEDTSAPIVVEGALAP